MPRTFETMGKELEKGEIELRLKRKEKEGRGGTENYVPRSREAYTRPPPSLETAHAHARGRKLCGWARSYTGLTGSTMKTRTRIFEREKNGKNMKKSVILRVEKC